MCVASVGQNRNMCALLVGKIDEKGQFKNLCYDGKQHKKSLSIKRSLGYGWNRLTQNTDKIRALVIMW